MTTRTKLAELARAARPDANEAAYVDPANPFWGPRLKAFQDAASPDVVLELLARIEQLEAGLNDALGGLSEVVPVMEQFYSLPFEFFQSLGVDADALATGKNGLSMLRSQIAALRSLANPERSGK